MKEDWNENDWQGRSKQQVESTYKLYAFSVIGLAICLLGILINNIA